MYGKAVSLYKATLQGDTDSDIATAFNNKTLVSAYFNFILPECNHSNWNSNLLQKTVVDRNGLNQDTMTRFDTYVGNWQQSMFFYNNTEYPFSWLETYYIPLFPRRINVLRGEIYFLWDNETNVAYYIRGRVSGSPLLTDGFYNRTNNYVTGKDSNVQWNVWGIGSTRVSGHFAFYDPSDQRIYRAANYGRDYALVTSNSNPSILSNVYGDFFTNAEGGYTPVNPPSDPYLPGGTTGPGGGTGTHDPYSSDPIVFNMLPEVSAVGTGFLSLWSPTEQQMLDLSEYMWNANPLTLDFWRRLIADPIQLIYGLNIIPLSLYDAGLIGGTESVVVGMINTGIKMDYLTSQWVELDCGTIDIEETWGAYLDYDPYTKLDIYLPYIGYRPLRVDDFMPGSIHVKYKIDLLTGACCAQISSTKSDEHGDTLDSVIYQFTGNCATQIPVTATQYADAVRSAISLAAAIGTVALLAGAGAPAAGAAGAAIMPGVDPVGLLNPPGMVPVDSELFGTMSQYNFMTAATDTGAVLKSAGGTLKNVGMIHAGASAAENVMGIKPSVQRSGAIGGAAGMLGIQTPYLIFTRPRQAVPENQSKYTGYPSFMTRQLSDLEGFTQIQSIHLEGIPCTANELAEIDALLKSGVIF